MQTTTLTYPSHDGTSTIRALVWEPDDAARPDLSPRAVVQLVHGMSEHVERYAPFAEFLVAHGFVVCANDHVGHGKTACSADDLGHMPLEAGEDALVEDVHALREKVHERYPGTRHVMFGHSMGSFVTRVYLTRHAEGLSAAILCGTGQQPRVQTVARPRAHAPACRAARRAPSQPSHRLHGRRRLRPRHRGRADERGLDRDGPGRRGRVHRRPPVRPDVHGGRLWRCSPRSSRTQRTPVLRGVCPVTCRLCSLPVPRTPWGSADGA